VVTLYKCCPLLLLLLFLCCVQFRDGRFAEKRPQPQELSNTLWALAKLGVGGPEGPSAELMMHSAAQLVLAMPPRTTAPQVGQGVVHAVVSQQQPLVSP
jgi:hypothetical protein